MRTATLLMFLLCGLCLCGQSLYYPPLFGDEWDTVTPFELGWCDEHIDNLDEFLETSNTKAFIVLQDGKIAMESYYNGHGRDSVWYWASAGKTLTAFQIGLAQEEGLLDIENSTSTYLGQGWTSCTEDTENNITIRHQLTMTTGLDYNMEITCFLPECLVCLNEPEQEWYYHNGAYTLLTHVIEEASDKTYNNYTNFGIGLDIGVFGAWIFVGNKRVFFSKSRAMARFGLLMLGEGNWDGKEIMTDKEYFTSMITPSQDINPSYGYLWWLNGQEKYRLPGSTLDFSGSIVPDAPSDMYAAIGINGQLIVVVPSENLVMIRIGENPDNSLVPINYINELWTEFEKVYCSVSSKNIDASKEVELFPNPSSKTVLVSGVKDIEKILIYDLAGELITQYDSTVLDVSELARGAYILHIFTKDGSLQKKMIKE